MHQSKFGGMQAICRIYKIDCAVMRVKIIKPTFRIMRPSLLKGTSNGGYPGQQNYTCLMMTQQLSFCQGSKVAMLLFVLIALSKTSLSSLSLLKCRGAQFCDHGFAQGDNVSVIRVRLRSLIMGTFKGVSKGME